MSDPSCSTGGWRLVRVQNFGVGSIRLQTVVGHSDKITIRRCGRVAADAGWSFRVRSDEHADARTGSRCWMTASI
jgi:hypothetical protein